MEVEDYLRRQQPNTSLNEIIGKGFEKPWTRAEIDAKYPNAPELYKKALETGLSGDIGLNRAAVEIYSNNANSWFSDKVDKELHPRPKEVATRTQISYDYYKQPFIDKVPGAGDVGFWNQKLVIPIKKRSGFFSELFSEGIPFVAGTMAAIVGGVSLTTGINPLNSVVNAVSKTASTAGSVSGVGVNLANVSGVGVNLGASGLGVGVQLTPAVFDQALAASTGNWLTQAASLADTASKAVKVVTAVNTLTGQTKQVPYGSAPENGWTINVNQTPQTVDLSLGTTQTSGAADGIQATVPTESGLSLWPFLAIAGTLYLVNKRKG